MMHEINTSSVSGTITVPTSKSYVQRFIAASILAKGESELFNSGLSDDISTSLNIGHLLGASTRVTCNNSIVVNGDFHFEGNDFFCRESGLCARLFTPIIALSGNDFIISGENSLNKRNLSYDLNQLKKFGLEVNFLNDNFPVSIKGQLKATHCNLDVSKTSQMLSGLLFALPLCDGESQICVNQVVSKPYIEMTLSVLRCFGIKIQWTDNIFIIPGNQNYIPQSDTAEGDWSSATNLIVAAALTGNLTIKNLQFDSNQADIKILEILNDAKIKWKKTVNGITVYKGKPKGFKLDLTDNPDLFPAIIPLACAADSKSYIYHVERLLNKESNRLEAIIREYTKMGAKFTKRNDVLEIKPAKLQFSDVNSWGDHRIIMSLCIAAMANKGACIHDSGHVSKSWPKFFTEIKKIGGKTNVQLR